MITLVIGSERYVVPRNRIQQVMLLGSLIDTCYDKSDLGLDVKPTITLPTPESLGTTKRALDDYVNFLAPNKNNDKQLLRECLQQCSLFGDQEYLWYCVKKLLFNYDDYKDLVDDVNDNLKRDIYLHFPYHLIPKLLIDNDIFFYSWVANIARVTRDDDIICVNQHDKYKYICYYSNNNNVLTSLSYFENYEFEDIKSGIRFVFDCHTGKKIHEVHYYNGAIHGTKIIWYPTGNKHLEIQYSHNKLHGVRTEWYESGRRKSQTHYVNNKRHGIDIEWFDADITPTHITTTTTTTSDNNNVVEQQQVSFHRIYADDKLVGTIY